MGQSTSGGLLDLQRLEAQWQFRAFGLQQTGDEIARLVTQCARTKRISEWDAGFPRVLQTFENEYKAIAGNDPLLFDSQRDLIGAATARNLTVAKATYSSITPSLFRDLPFEYIESQLIVTYGNMQRAFLDLMSSNQNLEVIQLQLNDMRQLLLSYCYLSLSEGLFEEALNFNYSLCFILNPTNDGARETGIREKVARINSTGFARLLRGYDPTIRNGTAHGHLSISSGNFTYNDRSFSVSRNYGQLYDDYMEMKKIAHLWQLHIFSHTLQTFAAKDLH